MEHELPAELQTVAIMGLGLIGGSLARDLSAHGVQVMGWDVDEARVRAAVDAGVVHDSLVDDPLRAGHADAVVFAVPVLAALKLLSDFAPILESARLITDVGSTKTSIVRAAESLGIGTQFVGSHPLAGDHRSGWDASREGLFADARVFLCPTSSSSGDAMRLASTLWTMVDARPEVMDAEQHDARLARTSHLPQAVSTALALSLAQSGTPRAELGPGGRDVTRLAGSDPGMWADILIDNAHALTPAIATMVARLAGLQRAMTTRDRDELRRLFAEARAWHQQE
jgi:prephenate dehydrogenase